MNEKEELKKLLIYKCHKVCWLGELFIHIGIFIILGLVLGLLLTSYKTGLLDIKSFYFYRVTWIVAFIVSTVPLIKGYLTLYNEKKNLKHGGEIID